MIKIHLTITLTEMQARGLYTPPDEDDQDAEPPTGQALAEAIAGYASRTIASNWEWDDGFSPDIKRSATTDTPALLAQFAQADALLKSTDTRALRKRRDDLAKQLSGSEFKQDRLPHARELVALYRGATTDPHPK